MVWPLIALGAGDAGDLLPAGRVEDREKAAVEMVQQDEEPAVVQDGRGAFAAATDANTTSAPPARRAVDRFTAEPS
jgi:hypothetical protein